MKRKFSHNVILWIGLVLWIGAAVARIINVLCGGASLGQDVMMEALKDTASIIVIILLIGVVMPIVEEFLFRFWIKSKREVTSLLLFLVLGGYVAISTYWWLGLAAFALCTMPYLLLKKNTNTRTVFLMCATSATFALAHITSFSSVQLDGWLCMAELCGLGLVACWLVYNIGFWWACLLHILNNAAALMLMLLVPTAPAYAATASDFDAPLYTAKLKPISGDAIDFREMNDSTIVVKGSLPVIAFNLVKHFNPDIISGAYSHTEYFAFNLAYKKLEPCWEYIVTFHDTIPYHNMANLVSDLALHSPLRIDTTYEAPYVVGIQDQQRINESSGDVLNTLAGLADDLRISYMVPVVLEKGTNEYFQIRYQRALFSFPFEIDSLPNILSSHLGLYMYKSDVQKIQVVRFRDY